MSQFGEKTVLSKEQLHRSVWRLMAAGKSREALAACQQLNRTYVDYADGWHVASHLAIKLGIPKKGLSFIDRALSLKEDNPGFLLQKARSLKALGRISQAMELARKLLTMKFPGRHHYGVLGDVFSELLLYPEAEQAYQRAHNHDPENPQILFNLAATQRFLGKIVEAEENCNQLIARNPEDYEVYLLRSELRRQTSDDNHIDQLLALVKQGMKNWQDESKLCNAIAKEYEDLGEYKNSFTYLQKSSAIRRSHMQYDIEPDLQTMQKIRSVFTADCLASRTPGYISEEPIFILGMPRTGTTLVERILDSHSQVKSAGELNNFARQLTLLAMQETGGKKIDRPQLVELTADLDFSALGESYIESTRPYTGELPHFIDKLPLNFLYTGLIHLALPQAKIIHLRRHPMDACYAIYKRLFRDAYPFSYDLAELGRYYCAYQGLMEHWHRVMPGVIHDVHYENLVTDIAGETRALLEYCGLPWEQECLDFHKSKSVSTTASAPQIRQKVYTSSVGKWRMYEDELQPLKDMLELHGVCCDESV
jgi:tetratricopeptide (TPR) repeat protein